jgi:hypothetical protein
MKKFTVADTVEPLEFEIGEDKFKAIAPERLPGNVLIRYAEQVSQGKLYEAHQIFFARCLEKESAELFAFRMDSKENPINLGVMAQVAEWLVEQYSAIPTEPPKQ